MSNSRSNIIGYVTCSLLALPLLAACGAKEETSTPVTKTPITTTSQPTATAKPTLVLKSKPLSWKEINADLVENSSGYVVTDSSTDSDSRIFASIFRVLSKNTSEPLTASVTMSDVQADGPFFVRFLVADRNEDVRSIDYSIDTATGLATPVKNAVSDSVSFESDNNIKFDIPIQRGDQNLRVIIHPSTGAVARKIDHASTGSLSFGEMNASLSRPAS